MERIEGYIIPKPVQTDFFTLPQAPQCAQCDVYIHHRSYSDSLLYFGESCFVSVGSHAVVFCDSEMFLNECSILQKDETDLNLFLYNDLRLHEEMLKSFGLLWC